MISRSTLSLARSRALSLALSAVLPAALVACSADDKSSSPPSAAGAMITPSTTTTVSAGSGNGSAPVSPARQRLDWVVDQINDPAPSADRVATGFSPAFLAQVGPEEVMAAVGSVVGSDTGWRVEDDNALGPQEGEAVLVSDEGGRLRVSLAVEADEPHLIVGLLVTPEPFAPGQPVTFEAIDAALSDKAEVAAYGLFEVTGGRCALVHGLAVDRPVPLGSAFKLWVLGALAQEIEAGRAAWDEEFPVDDGLKSSPDGEISALTAGTPVTLERYAELMISISDNSATDHLLARLGRDTVERATSDAGVADPSPNVPMLSTRELFLLKWGDPTRAGRYLALGPEDRRRYLDQDLAGVALAAEIGATFVPVGPARIDELEWFASAADLCRTQVWLAGLAETPGLEPTAHVLQLNPGLAFDPEWVDVRFKGGSEPGVAYASWRLVHRDGAVYVLTGGVSDRTGPVTEIAAVTILAAAAELVP